MPNLTLGSLFSGSGGFELAAKHVGITPIWASEIEPFAIRVTTKRLPEVQHFGNIEDLSGRTLPPVDIITFGSPCQDMSIAGKREGLSGSRSNLFYEAVRIIQEMREETHGNYPTYCVWENVPGVFSSGGREDFRIVLESLCRIKDKTISVPASSKWTNAGTIMGDGYSIAWRLLDAQYFGVPQRRKRIYLIADFAGQGAGKILFESDGLPGNSSKGIGARQSTAGRSERSAGDASTLCLMDQGGSRMDVIKNRTNTLRAKANHPPLVFENHPQDARVTGPLEKAPATTARYGTGGGNTPLIAEPKTLKIRSGKEGGGKGALVQDNLSATISTHNDQTLFEPVAYGFNAVHKESGAGRFGYKTDLSKTLDTSGISPTCNQGGIAVVFSTSKTSYHTDALQDKANTLVASDYKDPPIINANSGPQYMVRRLTPTECARLMGFPDPWCQDLSEPNPSEDDLVFWREVFLEWQSTQGKTPKPKTDKQLQKWLADPYSDSAEYKLWGNGIALPCAEYVLRAIAENQKK